jgi:hypothetical protein
VDGFTVGLSWITVAQWFDIYREQTPTTLTKLDSARLAMVPLWSVLPLALSFGLILLRS